MVNMHILDNSYTFWLSRLAGQLQESFNKELAVLDVSWSQWMVINLIAHERAKTPAQIAQIIGVDRSAITRLVDRLEKKGMVSRQPMGEDKRSVRILLSDAGARLVSHLDEAAQAHERSVAEAIASNLGENALSGFKSLVESFRPAVA